MPRIHGSGMPGNLRFSAREQLKEIIQHMDLEQDNRLPPELELANQLGIGRTTLRKILEELELEGVVIRRKGKGTFVNLPDPRITLSPCTPWQAEALFARRGYRVSHRMVDCQHRTAHPESPEDGLGLPGQRVTTVSQVLYLDQWVYGVRVTSFVSDPIPDALFCAWLKTCDPLPTFLAGRGMTVTRRRSTITAVSPLRCAQLFSCLGGSLPNSCFLQMDSLFSLGESQLPQILWREYSHTKWISYLV